MCGAPSPAPTISLCSERCTSLAQQEVQANAASVRVGTDGEERRRLLHRNSRLMEAMLHHRRTGSTGGGRGLTARNAGPDADPDDEAAR